MKDVSFGSMKAHQDFQFLRLCCCDLTKFFTAASVFMVPDELVFESIYFEMLDRFGVDKTLDFFRKCLEDE